jgi:hypothetical protein
VGRYELGTPFVIRVTGVPFELLDSLATPETIEAARRVAEEQERLRIASEAAVDKLKVRPPSNQRSRLLKRIGKGMPLELATPDPELTAYEEAQHARDHAGTELEAVLVREEAATRTLVRRHALAVLPDYAVIASQTLYEGLKSEPPGDASVPRNKARHWALYLQRVCAKNDSIGRFGPITWGRVARDSPAFVLELSPGIARRRTACERWVARALHSALNQDAEVRLEVAPLLHPDGRLEETSFVRFDLGQEVALAADELAVVAKCDGTTPARAIGSLDVLARLSERGVIIWEHRLAGGDPDPVATLAADVAAWADGPARQRWKPVFDELVRAGRQYAESSTADIQVGAMDAVRDVVTRIGAAVAETSRAQYRAVNPMCEETYREGRIALDAKTLGDVLDEAAPWFDLNHDIMCFAASMAFARLAEIYTRAPRHRGKVWLPAFLAECAKADVDLMRWGLPQIGQAAFKSLLPELSAALGDVRGVEERQLGVRECHVVRNNHSFVRYPELSSPSVDIQIAARSVADVCAGRCEWIIAETHTYPFPIQYAGSWACPDPQALRAAMGRVTQGRPVLLHTHAALDMPVHNPWFGRMTYVPGLNYVAKERPPSGVQAIRPGDAEVVLDEANHDLRVRHTQTGSDLGSLVRSDLLMNAINPYSPFQGADEMPRLRVGRAIVQRRTWILRREELGEAELPSNVSGATVLAVERLRGKRQLPRWIYVKPADEVTSTDARARDKDRKPIYIDLESYTFIDLFARWIDKYGALEATEMSPAPDQLCWREPDGTRSFEIRAIVHRTEET